MKFVMDIDNIDKKNLAVFSITTDPGNIENLKSNDRLLVNMIPYDIKDLKDGDLIVAKFPMTKKIPEKASTVRFQIKDGRPAIFALSKYVGFDYYYIDELEHFECLGRALASVRSYSDNICLNKFGVFDHSN